MGLNERDKNASVFGVVGILTIISTVLTQIPAISGYVRISMYAMWIFAFAIGIIHNKGVVPCNRFMAIYILVVLFIGLECVTFYNSHSHSFLFRVIPLPLLCYFVGLMYSKSIDKKMVRVCLLIFYVTSFVMFLYIFVTYVGSLSSWFNASYYIYEQKNSAAQIIACSIIIAAFLLKTEKRWLKFAKYFSLVVLFLILISMQCRTALIALIITAGMYYFVVLHGKKKIAVTVLFLVALVLVINNDLLSQYVQKAFIFSKRQTMSIDGFTSGRLTNFSEAWSMFKEHPIIGTGHYRVDNLYLFTLADVGLVGFLPVLILWISRIRRNVLAFIKDKNELTSCLLCLTVFYLCESFSEAYPPFGPGVCAFMFWIVCAFVDSGWGHSEKSERIVENDVI